MWYSVHSISKIEKIINERLNDPVIIDTTKLELSGNRLPRWMIEFCTPGPPKAMSVAPTNAEFGTSAEEVEKMKHPRAIAALETAEHSLGPL